MEQNNELFRELSQINVNDYVEQKNGLTYLSWANAIQEICKSHNAEFSYVIKRNEQGLPYVYDEGVGFMVFTEVTINGITRECWLPVMDSNNNAMLKTPYTYEVKKYVWENRKKVWNGEYETKEVAKCTMFDVNKTIMRCLVKNLAMFGLGLYIYAGEDLPFDLGDKCTQKQVDRMRELQVLEANVCKNFGAEAIEDLTFSQAQYVISTKEKSMNEGK